MKNIILAVALCLLSSQAHAQALQPWQGGTGCESGVAVADLPSSPLIGTICTITDGADEYDVSVGGGNKTNIAIYTGAPAGGVDFGWKQIDLDYTAVSDTFYVTQDTDAGLPRPSVIPSCRNGADGGVLEYNTSTHAFVCVTTTRLSVVSASSDVTTGLCFWSTGEGSIQCGNTTGVRTMLTKAVAATTYAALDGSNEFTGDLDLGVNVELIFEGSSADAFETTIGVINPTSPDKTINFPDASGTVAVSASGSLALSATGDVTLSDDGVTEAKLKAVDAPADEECFTYEATGGDFEWQACGGGGGNSFETIDTPSGTDPVADSSTDTLALTATAGMISITGDSATDTIEFALVDGSITEAKLKAVDAPGDEECFTYETTTGDFEWQTCTPSAGTGAFLLLDGSNDPVTGQVIFTAAGSAPLIGVQDSSGSAASVGVQATNNVDSAGTDALLVQGPQRATPANGDNVNVVFQLYDSAGSYVEVASVRVTANDVATTAVDGGLTFYGITGGVQTEMLRVMTTTAGQANVVVNEGGNDIDFRVETDARANAIYCSGANDSCTFGSQTELGFIGIDGQADEAQFVVQGAVGQSADLVVFENSSGTDGLTISVDGLITDYGAEATVARGVPAIVAQVALTGQTTDISATTLYTAPAVDTTVRVSVYTIITTPATSSSVLGSLGISYTDADNGTTQNMTMRCNNRTGTSVTSVTGNSQTTSLNCEAVVRMNASSSMTYEQSHNSTGGTTMTFSTYWTVERLQ